MKFAHPSVLGLIFLVMAVCCHAGPMEDPATEGIIKRFAAGRESHFVLEDLPPSGGRDVYEVESADGRIVLRGNSGVARASAFYHYLKEACNAHVSWNGDNLDLPESLPPVPAKVRVVSPVRYRMAYNYCTHGYTMPFWDERQWRREIDWLALHGVNMALIIQGQEAVWQNTFARFGYSREEMRQWLCSPVHLPWQFMQNMQGVLPPPQPVIDRRAALGKWIVDRCCEHGIRPVLQGYYGMLPSGFAAKHPGVRIVPQGGWAGGNTRPDMLDPADPMFARIAAAFYQEQRRIFGPCGFFAADPFHEGGRSDGLDRGAVYQQVQGAMLASEPDAILVKQCWQTSNKEMFDAGNRERSLALDLWCDCRPFWRKADGYSGTPWGWCFLGNFGGNLALEGNPRKLAADFGATLAAPDKRRLEATALVPEGSSTNPMVYELMTEMAWRGAPADFDAWMEKYLLSRYGRRNADAAKAWRVILDTAYAVQPAEGPVNSVITARPSLDKNLKGRTWSPGSRVPYGNTDLAEAWTALLAAAPELGHKDTFRHDLADVGRQVLVNLSRPVYENAVDAYQAGDRVRFREQSGRFLELLADLDDLTGTRPGWLAGAWVRDAGNWGATPAEKAYMERIARMILTTWVESPHTDLADYANREWNGLLGGYYAGRWRMFFTELGAALDGTAPFDPQGYQKRRGGFEVRWVSGAENRMPVRPAGDTVEVSRKLHGRYLPLLSGYYPVRLPLTPEFVTGTWKYQAEGAWHLREFRADRTVRAYSPEGARRDWFDGFTWEIKNRRLVLTRGPKVIFHERRGEDTLDFTSEGFGVAKRVEDPVSNP